MRKLSTIAAARNQAYALDVELHDIRQRHVPRSTITSWPGTIDIDLTILLATPQAGASIASATPASTIAETAGKTPDRYASCSGSSTVSLSDGTRITFASAGQVTIVETME